MKNRGVQKDIQREIWREERRQEYTEKGEEGYVEEGNNWDNKVGERDYEK